MKKLLVLTLSLFLSLTGFCQYTYLVNMVNGDSVIYRIDFSGNSVQVKHLPSDAIRSKNGARRLVNYSLESKRVFNVSQFGEGKYYDSTYRFSVDFNPTLASPTARKLQGVNMFSRFVATESEYGNLPPPQKFYYQTENELHGPYEGAKYYESTLAEIESWLYAHIPSNVGYWVANIETSNEWHQWQYVNGPYNHGYDSWNTAKSRTIVSERPGVGTITLEQLWNSGQWDNEMMVRRNNRLDIMLTIARSRNTYAAYGSSMYQGEPKTDALTTTNLFKEGSADVSAIGGSNGTITLNGRTYTGVNRNVYQIENSMLDYFYFFYFNISRSDYNDIWVNKVSGTQNYSYVWSKIQPEHIVAKEKGHWQANKYRMLNISGQTNRGSVRMQESIYEADRAGIVAGQYPGEIQRIPFNELQNSIVIGSYVETPKIWLPPYLLYSTYVVHRFLEGNTPGSGFHFWNDPYHSRFAPTSNNEYNQELHTVSALYQGRNDLQFCERFYAGSTLVVDPEVQLNQSGGWSSYSGAEAYALSPDGTRGTQKPAYILRYKPTTSGWQVVIVGGTNQGWSESRTDLVRVQGGALNGNVFRVKLTGPSAHIFEFAVSSSDSGQTYDATSYTISTQAGYAGRISSN